MICNNTSICNNTPRCIIYIKKNKCKEDEVAPTPTPTPPPPPPPPPQPPSTAIKLPLHPTGYEIDSTTQLLQPGVVDLNWWIQKILSLTGVERAPMNKTCVATANGYLKTFETVFEGETMIIRSQFTTPPNCQGKLLEIIPPKIMVVNRGMFSIPRLYINDQLVLQSNKIARFVNNYAKDGNLIDIHFLCINPDDTAPVFPEFKVKI